MQHIQIGVALLERAGSILLVQQQGASDTHPMWALPGGVVESGELPTDAMIREVAEETGLEVLAPGCLLYVVSSVEPTHGATSTAFVFAVTAWRGDLQPAAPDDPVHVAQFVPQDEAVALLQQLPWSKMYEPIVAYLRREIAPGALWLYHDHPDGTTTYVGCVEAGAL